MTAIAHPESKISQPTISPASPWLRETVGRKPHASIIVPVNAKGHLQTVQGLLADLNEYRGPFHLEVILVINNYTPAQPPKEIDEFLAAGYRVISEPDAHQPGRVVIVSARMIGVRAAYSNITIHFDADCRIPNSTALLNWYISVLQDEAALAYTHVSFFELRPALSIQAKIALHHTSRFIKRSLFGIPTTRGSNYAVLRRHYLSLFHDKKICVDLHVGPAVKLGGGKIAYSGRKDFYVYTSGRRFMGGWSKLPRYLFRRLIYNIRSLSILWRSQPNAGWMVFDQENQNRALLDISDSSGLPSSLQPTVPTLKKDKN